MKEYMMELSERFNIEFEEVTQEHMERDFRDKAQAVWHDDDSSLEERQNCKQYLDKITYSKIKHYHADTTRHWGNPKFQVGDVMMDSYGIFHLIIQD
jgi:ABC-type dipeptide/oligopeptide/nickel transport system ATPase subunit